MGTVGRGLLLTLLALGMAGFGLCSLCGGVVGLMSLGDASRIGVGIFWVPSAVGGVLAWLCWRGFRALRRRADRDPGPFDPPPAP